MLEAVQRGKELLDEKLPGWKLETSIFNIKSSERCVLGQNYGSYLDGCHELELRGCNCEDCEYANGKPKAMDYGFSCDYNRIAEYEQAWIDAYHQSLKARKAKTV